MLYILWYMGLKEPLHLVDLPYSFFFSLQLFINVLFNLNKFNEIFTKLNNLNSIISYEILRQMSKDDPSLLVKKQQTDEISEKDA